MRISGYRNDPGYNAYINSPYGTTFTVTIDDEEVTDRCCIADEEAGYVALETFLPGSDIPVMVAGCFQYEQRLGDVVITIKEPTEVPTFIGRFQLFVWRNMERLNRW